MVKPALRMMVMLALVVSFSIGCVSNIDEAARREFFRGNFSEAAELLDQAEHPEGYNRLLHLMDRGVIYHTAERYPESNTLLLEAARVWEEMDITRVSAEAASLLTSDVAKDYRGEDYEQLLIRLYLAMNFLLSGDRQGAYVEMRSLHIILNEFSKDESKHYKLNAFAYYIAGLIYELAGELAEAYLDYKRVHELVPGSRVVRSDLLRLSRELGFNDDYEKWRAQFGEDVEVKGIPGGGEVVILFQCGLSPEKVPMGFGTTLTKYEVRPQSSWAAAVYVNGAHVANTEELHNLEATIIKNWEAYTAGQVAKEAARVGVKYGISEVIESKWGQTAGDLAKLTFLATQQPDTRCWLTLPRAFHIARFPIAAGVHTIKIQFVGVCGSPTGGERLYERVEVKPGDVVILSARSVE